MSSKWLILGGAVSPVSASLQESKHQKHKVNMEGDRDPEYGIKAELESLGNMKPGFLASYFSLQRDSQILSLYLLLAVYSWSWSSHGIHMPKRRVII